MPMPSSTFSVVALLAERPEADLRKMQAGLDAERLRLERDLARIELESEQIADALARQARAAAKPRTRPSPTRPGATQKRILDAVARLPQPVSPAEIIAEMESGGSPAGNKGTIHNAIARLVKVGKLNKLDVGQYQLASRNGSSGESHTGPTENEPTGPLSTATGAQEAS